jgi:hypothetical protein
VEFTMGNLDSRAELFHSGQEEDPEDRRLQSEYLSKLMGDSPRPLILLSGVDCRCQLTHRRGEEVVCGVHNGEFGQQGGTPGARGPPLAERVSVKVDGRLPASSDPVELPRHQAARVSRLILA